MGKTEKRKGRRGELELAKTLQDYGFQVCAGESQNFGRTPDLMGLTDIHIECKRVEHLNISEAMTQAVRDSEKFKDGYPTVFHRKNGEKWLVTMRLEDWIQLYKCQSKNISERLDLWERANNNDVDALIALGEEYLNQHH